MTFQQKKNKVRIPPRILAFRHSIVMKNALPLSLLAVILLTGGLLLHRNFISNYKARQVAELRSTVNSTQERENELRNRKRYLQTPAGIKAKGIEKGFLEKGDYPVRFTPQQTASATPLTNVKKPPSDNSGVVAAVAFIFAVVFILTIGLLLYRRRRMRKPRSENVLTPRAEIRRDSR